MMLVKPQKLLTLLDIKLYIQPHTTEYKGGFPLLRNFYVRTDVNFNWLYVHKLK